MHIWKRICYDKGIDRVKHIYQCIFCGEQIEVCTWYKVLSKYRIRKYPFPGTKIKIGKRWITIWKDV